MSDTLTDLANAITGAPYRIASRKSTQRGTAIKRWKSGVDDQTEWTLVDTNGRHSTYDEFPAADYELSGCLVPKSDLIAAKQETAALEFSRSAWFTMWTNAQKDGLLNVVPAYEKQVADLTEDRDHWRTECEKSRRREAELAMVHDADLAAAAASAIEVRQYDIESHAASYNEGYAACARQSSEPLPGYDEPDATNPIHLRFAADVLQGFNLNGDATTVSGGCVGLNELRTAADRIEAQAATDAQIDGLAQALHEARVDRHEDVGDWERLGAETRNSLRADAHVAVRHLNANA